MKYLIHIITILFVVSLCGCAPKNSYTRSVVYFYYKTQPVEYMSENGVISVEERTITTPPTDYFTLLEQYLNGARSSTCVSPFPAGTTIKDFSINGSVAAIQLSPHLTILTGSDLTVACVCLAKTIFDMADVQAVQISAQNSLINNEPYLTIERNDFVLTDVTTEMPY